MSNSKTIKHILEMKQDRRIEAVLFDLDDTLIDWANIEASREEFYQPRVKRLHDYLTGLGLDLPKVDKFQSIIDQAIFATWEEAKKTWSIRSYGDVLDQVLLGIGLDVDGLDTNEMLRIFGWDPWPGVVVFPDTISVLEELRDRGYELGLLTNSFLPMWMRDRELEFFNLLSFFEYRLTAADIGYVKPHPNIYYELLDRMEVSPDRAVFVGDRPKNDIAGANAVGLVSVLMDPPHLTRDLDGVVPDYVIPCLTDLLPILDELNRDNSAGAD